MKVKNLSIIIIALILLASFVSLGIALQRTDLDVIGLLLPNKSATLEASTKTLSPLDAIVLAAHGKQPKVIPNPVQAIVAEPDLEEKNQAEVLPSILE